jgi:CRP/FNR family cyclic AMP-dependent transcriptional regulator
MPGAPTTVQLAALTDPTVRQIAGHGQMRSFPKHAIIINEGDASNSVFIILTGRVKVFSSDEGGREIVFNDFGPGEYIGEMSLDGRPRSASVMTLEPSTFSVVDRDQFRAAIAANPDIALQIISTLITRARIASTSVKNLALLDVYGRVARLLLDLAEDKDGVLVIPDKLTQQDIGDRVGASRDMVSRIFKDLVAGGYIKNDHKIITILRKPPERW